MIPTNEQDFRAYLLNLFTTDAELSQAIHGASDVHVKDAFTQHHYAEEINNLIAAAVGEFASLTSPVATSGTGDTALFSGSLSANALNTGFGIEVDLAGLSSSTGTLIFKIHVGPLGTTADPVAATSVTTAAQVANGWAHMKGLIIVRSVGSNGTCIASIVGADNTAGLANATAGAAVTTIDTTSTLRVTLSVTCSIGVFTAQLGSMRMIPLTKTT